MRHASCPADSAPPAGYESDSDDGAGGGAPCPCSWHPVLIEQLSDDRSIIAAWPGPFCGTCWASECACGYVFEAAGDAFGRDSRGRLVCHSPACRPRAAQA